MIQNHNLRNALVIALLGGSVALAGCRKNDATPDEMPSPTADAPADAAAPPPMTGSAPPMAEAAAVSVSAVAVGKSAAEDKSVAPASQFAPSDDVIVSVRTEGTASNANVTARLSFQDGQVAGEQSATLNTSGAETTNITFHNANGWPVGKYRAEVMVDGQPAGTAQEFEVK